MRHALCSVSELFKVTCVPRRPWLYNDGLFLACARLQWFTARTWRRLAGDSGAPEPCHPWLHRLRQDPGSRQERKARCWDARGSCPPLGRPGPCRSSCEGRAPRQREVFSLLLHRRGNRGPERKRLWSPPPGGAWLAVLAERGWRARSPGGTPVEKGQQRRCTGGQATVTGVGAGPP